MEKKIIINMSIILLLVISVGIAMYFVLNNSQVEERESGFGGLSRRATELQESDKVFSDKNTQIFVVALDGSELIKTVDGEMIGCNDKLLAVDLGKSVSPRIALEKLFDYQGDEEGIYNVFANSGPIIIDSFDIVDGKAIVYLSANGLGGGTCDAPRIKQQLKKTLLQFDNIDSTEIYFDDELIDDYLSEKD